MLFDYFILFLQILTFCYCSDSFSLETVASQKRQKFAEKTSKPSDKSATVEEYVSVAPLARLDSLQEIVSSFFAKKYPVIIAIQFEIEIKLMKNFDSCVGRSAVRRN